MNLSKYNHDGSLNLKNVYLAQISVARKARRFENARAILAYLRLIVRLERECGL